MNECCAYSSSGDDYGYNWSRFLVFCYLHILWLDLSATISCAFLVFYVFVIIILFLSLVCFGSCCSKRPNNQTDTTDNIEMNRIGQNSQRRFSSTSYPRNSPYVDPHMFQIYRQIDNEDLPPAYVDLEKQGKLPGFVVNVNSVKKEDI